MRPLLALGIIISPLVSPLDKAHGQSSSAAAEELPEYYKIDAVLADGIMIRSEGSVHWIDVSWNDTAKRQRILAGAGKERPSLAENGAHPEGGSVEPGAPRADGGSPILNGPTGSFTFQPSPQASRNIGLLAGRIESVYKAEERQRTLEYHLAIARSPRELPWEFVGNQVQMWAMWFGLGAPDSPEDRAIIDAYIAEQHSPLKLLERLLIKPFAPRERKE